jgi:pyruvate-formate lyase-activating enzyme
LTSFYIPNVVETDQLEKIARHPVDVGTGIPFTILAFFPEHHMGSYRAPTTLEMISAYHSTKAAGLRHVRLGNLGVFAQTEADHDVLRRHVPIEDR